jgi:hypothetical protein
MSNSRSCSGSELASISNATSGTATWNGAAYSCQVTACNSTYHVEGNSCMSNTRSCNGSELASIPNSSTGTATWNGSVYSCQVSSCNSTYHVEGNSCMSDSRACNSTELAAIPNATSGTATWNGSAYSCQISACNSSYHVDSNSCMSNTRACTPAEIALVPNATSGTATWNGSAYACAPTACSTDSSNLTYSATFTSGSIAGGGGHYDSFGTNRVAYKIELTQSTKISEVDMRIRNFNATSGYVSMRIVNDDNGLPGNIYYGQSELRSVKKIVQSPDSYIMEPFIFTDDVVLLPGSYWIYNTMEWSGAVQWEEFDASNSIFSGNKMASYDANSKSWTYTTTGPYVDIKGTKLPNNYHVESNSCVSDYRNCIQSELNTVSNASAGYAAWSGSAYSCKATACSSSFFKNGAGGCTSDQLIYKQTESTASVVLDSAVKGFAQKIVFEKSGLISTVDLYMKKVGTPSGLIFAELRKGGTSPVSTRINFQPNPYINGVSINNDIAQIPTSFTKVSFSGSNVFVTAGETYWIVAYSWFGAALNASNYIEFATKNTGRSDSVYMTTNVIGGSFSIVSSGLEMQHNVYLKYPANTPGAITPSYPISGAQRTIKSSADRIAQRFTIPNAPGATGFKMAVSRLFILTQGNPSASFIMDIYTDNAGSPGTLVGSSAAGMGSFSYSSPLSGGTYWYVLRPTSVVTLDASNYYYFREVQLGNDGFTGYGTKTSTNSGSSWATGSSTDGFEGSITVEPYYLFF